MMNPKNICAKALSLAIVALTFSFSSIAQEKKPATKPVGETKHVTQPPHVPTKSRFSPPAQYLMKFSGKWSADALFISDGKTYHVKYEIIGRPVADGAGMLIDESFNDSVMGKMRGENLIAYDSADGKIHWYNVSSDAAPHEHTGTWVSPDSLIVEHKSARKGKTYTEKFSFGFKGIEEMSFNFVSALDGKESDKVVAVFHRQMPPKKEVPNKPAPPVEKKD